MAFEQRHRFRFSERAWKAFVARAQELNPREIDPLLRAGGLPFVVSSIGYYGGQMDYLGLNHTEQPPFSLSIYAKGKWVVCAVWSEDEDIDIRVVQSLVKRLSNWMRSLESAHAAQAGAETGAGQCAEVPLRPQGSQHAAGSRQDAPFESPTGDSDGAERPEPPRVGVRCRSGRAKCVARHDRPAVDNPAASGSGTGERATDAPVSCADANIASASEAPADAAPSAGEASGGDELIPPDEAGEAPREWSTVPSAAVARGEDAAVRQARRNILRQFARHASAASNAACRAYGGQFASIRAHTPDPTLVRQLRQIFARLAQGGETEPSARWDSRRVALKAAGYLRSWTTHDRRLESGRPAILVLPDVSGSMGQFAREVTALAAAVAELGVPGADVVIVVHSNGYPIEIKTNRGSVQEVRVDDDEVFMFYERLIRRYEVKLALIAADWDGEWLYRWLASRPNIERLVWLDVYCSSYGEPRARRFPPKWLEGEPLEAWKSHAHRVRYADRCSSAADCVAALEMLIGGIH